MQTKDALDDQQQHEQDHFHACRKKNVKRQKVKRKNNDN